MDLETAARRWAETWSRAWPQRDVEAVVALYADAAMHHSTPFRQPGLGRAGVGRYLTDNFGAGIRWLRPNGASRAATTRTYTSSSSAIPSKNRPATIVGIAEPSPLVRVRPVPQAQSGSRALNGWPSGTELPQVTSAPLLER